MIVIELIEQLQQLNQPHAEVRLSGCATCYESHSRESADVLYEVGVVEVRSRHPRVVILRGEEG